MESVSGVRCAIAQGGSCGVRTQGTTRVRARDAPTRGTVTWVRSRDTATEYSHRALSQATHHRVTTQGTATGYCHRIPSQCTRHWKHFHESLPQINATAQRHSGI